MDALFDSSVLLAATVWMPFAGATFAIVALFAVGVVGTLAVAWLMRQAERRIRGGRLAGAVPGEEYGKQVSTVMGLLRAVLLALLWVVVVVTALSQAGLDIAPILAGAGILGLAVGFGAQSLVRDVIGGVFHVLENQLRVGDVVVVNGVGGVVERIGYRIIVLRDAEQVVHVIPHGTVGSLANHTKERSAMVLDVGVAYKEDPDRVIASLRAVGQAMMDDPDWQRRLLEPLEVLGLDSFGDSAVNYRVRFKTRPGEQWSVKREFQRRLKQAFDREGIGFPFPHRTLYVAEGTAPMPVRLVGGEQA